MSFDNEIHSALAELPIGRFVVPPLDAWSTLLGVHRQRAGLSLRKRMKLTAVTEHGGCRIDLYKGILIARIYVIGYQGQDSHVHWLRDDVGDPAAWIDGRPPAHVIDWVLRVAREDLGVKARYVEDTVIRVQPAPDDASEAAAPVVAALPAPQPLRLVEPDEVELMRALACAEQVVQANLKTLQDSQHQLALLRERWQACVEHHSAALRRLGIHQSADSAAQRPMR